MKNLILITLCITFSLFAFCACSFNKQKENVYAHAVLTNKLVVGVKCDSKPFGFVAENGEIQGFDVDVAKAVSQNIIGNENALELVCVNAQGRIGDLNSKKVDMLIAAMSITDARANVVRFSSPYYIAGQAVMVKNNSRIMSFGNLNNANVGFVLGTTGERTIRRLAPAANLRAAKNYSDVFELLKKGEIDAILADDSMLYGILSENIGYKILPKRYTKEYYAIALRQNQESDELFEEVNSALGNMQQNGTLNKIKAKWIPNLHY